MAQGMELGWVADEHVTLLQYGFDLARISWLFIEIFLLNMFYSIVFQKGGQFQAKLSYQVLPQTRAK